LPFTFAATMRFTDSKRRWLLGLLLLGFLVSARADDNNGTNELWRLRLPEGGATSSCALAPDGTIYQGTFGGRLLAVTPTSHIKWKYQTRGEIFSSPAVADDGTIYCGSRDRNLYALTPDGKLKWTFATGAWVDSSPAIATDGTVYFGSWDKKFYALTPDGKLKWAFATSNLVTASPALAADGTIYFGSHDSHFYALTPDGKLKWSFATGAPIESSAAIAEDGTIYFGSGDGNLYALHPDGTIAWRLHTGNMIASQPVLDIEGNLYLAANREHIAVSRDGKMLWHHPTDCLLEMAWAVPANGTVYASQPWLQICALDRKNGWPPIWYYTMAFNLAASPNVNPAGVIYTCDSYNLFAFCPTNAAPLEKSSWPMWRADPRHTGRVQR
jgi:outer membrane protein assembly factor BamB